MSYLHAPRLVFTGDFLSDVSTVNNDPAHYNNTTFKPNFQEPGKGATNGWWNPEGGAVFDFQNCAVKQIFLPDGTTQSDPAADIIIGQAIQGADGRPTGKMVDLDPDAQMYSAIWCVQLRICDKNGGLLFKGDVATTSFRDIQMRQLDGGKSNGQPLGATWTSLITNVVWGDLAEQSPFLKTLRATTQDNTLAINMNPFGYYYAHNDGRFSLGRIMGSIGPYFVGEPTTFAATRRLYGINYTPSIQGTYFSVSNFLVEQAAKRVSVDFGASFPVSDSIGTIHYNQDLRLAVSKVPQTGVASASTPVSYISPDDLIEIGTLDYQNDPGWLNQTAGIVSFSDLPDATVSALASNQLILITPSTAQPGQYAIIAREAIDGLVMRADNFIQRLDDGQSVNVDFYSYQWGNALPDTAIGITLDPPTANTPVGPGNPISEVYGNNFPASGLSFEGQVTTGPDGKAQVQITGNAINSPRVYIDGQIYFITYQAGTVDAAFGTENVVVHLRDYFAEIADPVWDDISEMMVQYSNLYPIMSKYVVNLADPAALAEKKNILIFAFSRDMNDTMHMPVTRDLSGTKRQTILNWLNNPQIAPRPALRTQAKQAVNANPVAPGTALTDRQAKYREAVKAKNGSFPGFRATENLFENL
ncbi:hypothetical protein GCM10010967_55040 [Dyadobacter beijingensis]|uniref:Uncharacterized protein n=1 Tax=Dyadobacter beijingensis TaxID=365489 RepID=A0ABQ2IJ90_9BACT|nr:hypothetical protein [Dyadobacter beijingensis]GGN12067.1 hypothetical protein GCM10010967_55040 [Dyadobacter beijingensis]